MTMDHLKKIGLIVSIVMNLGAIVSVIGTFYVMRDDWEAWRKLLGPDQIASWSGFKKGTETQLLSNGKTLDELKRRVERLESAR